MAKIQEKFDVAVIGGGSAGMMAALKAAESGASVVLIEKNQSLGRKLLLTGNGRCNLSQAEFNDKKFVEKLGKKGQWFFSALAAFGPEETMKFFEEKGLPIKTERGGRVFPVSDKAQDVLNIFLAALKKNKVSLLLGQEVIGFDVKNKKMISVKLKNAKIMARAFVLCAGGKAYPGTGSTGSGYAWLQKMGHKIAAPRPALVPLRVKEGWTGDLQGLGLKNVSAEVWQNNVKIDSRFGEMLFTHFGVSGPIILDLSKKVVELLPAGEVILKIDLKPALDILTLDKRLQRDFKGNRNFKNYLPELVPRKLIDLILRFTKIEANKKLNSITREEREKLIETLKGLKLTVKDSLGFVQAIVTNGGVDLAEIDSKTMRSKIIDNLYLAGEIIDLDGPTGGYNLQICWSTGCSAGAGAGQAASQGLA